MDSLREQLREDGRKGGKKQWENKSPEERKKWARDMTKARARKRS